MPWNLKTFSHGQFTISPVYFNNYYTLISREEQEQLRWEDYEIKEISTSKDIQQKRRCGWQGMLCTAIICLQIQLTRYKEIL